MDGEFKVNLANLMRYKIKACWCYFKPSLGGRGRRSGVQCHSLLNTGQPKLHGTPMLKSKPNQKPDGARVERWGGFMQLLACVRLSVQTLYYKSKAEKHSVSFIFLQNEFVDQHLPWPIFLKKKCHLQKSRPVSQHYALAWQDNCHRG